MQREPETIAITIRASKVMLSEVDIMARELGKSRDYVINQALERYLEANPWQLELIKQGIADARAGHVSSSADVHAEIAAKHGFGA